MPEHLRLSPKICWFVLDFGIYSEADAHTIGLLAIGFVISRTLSGLSLVSFRMAKNTGLAATFSDMALKSSADRDDLLSDRMCRTFAVSGSTVRNGRADRGIAAQILVPPFILRNLAGSPAIWQDSFFRTANCLWQSA